MRGGEGSPSPTCCDFLASSATIWEVSFSEFRLDASTAVITLGRLPLLDLGLLVVE